MKPKFRYYFASALSALAFSVTASVATAADRDDQIENSFKNSHVYRTQLKNTDLSIDSDAGVVTLSGKVDNEDQKRLAEDTVRATPGVQRINNELKVTHQPKESSDEWIATKVRGSLLFHRNVGLTDTDVAVTNGVVVLTGTAKTAAEKSLAAEYAADVSGVTKVDNKIQVMKPDAAAAARADGLAAQASSDADRMSAEARKDAKRIRAEAREDTAEARAEMKEEAAEAKRAAQASGRTVGEKIDDASITAQLKYAMSVRRSTSAMRTEVTTNSGVVTIRGEAKSAAEKELVTELAKGIEGVGDVRNEMTIAGH